MSRFIVKDGSLTEHCCFEATVIDTEQRGGPEQVCECLCKGDAQYIVVALNYYAEAKKRGRKNAIPRRP